MKNPFKDDTKNNNISRLCNINLKYTPNGLQLMKIRVNELQVQELINGRTPCNNTPITLSSDRSFIKCFFFLYTAFLLKRMNLGFKIYLTFNYCISHFDVTY